jgi:hypothetical protein
MGGVSMGRIMHEQVSELQDIRDVPNAVSTVKTRDQVGDLQDECAVFTHYLVGEWPNQYVVGKYREAHAVSHIFENVDPSSFDGFLLNMATNHPFGTRLVDAYTAVFSKSSIFRKKMILLMAILESCAPTYLQFDRPDPTPSLVLVVRLLQRGCAFGLSFFLSTVFLLPIHVGFSVVPGRAHRGG